LSHFVYFRVPKVTSFIKTARYVNLDVHVQLVHRHTRNRVCIKRNINNLP